ncbi:MAG: SCP-2 sterol transfer family protein [Thiotrichales bacterium]|jgi:hypothetical protein|nr:SCP-2 sterol transfer family protein [Thiotrichales bacterium]MBT3612857.1 SCP-2 sterol transfer family protein [Thiotrichales bacterium]MBT3752759.1 SCP-2 sterol transfer family protein [Thiotrichales bacterium]MBT3836758.1 SCP-2 sterol transfer family protein [Thiotrichales bacterium]MBT4152412.1 SCP-2 sterol transfer family protein [Thiotrichales bacterium]
MATLFSDDWMNSFMGAWNSDGDLVQALADIGFSSTIAYGIQGEDKARGFLVIENGKATSAGAYDGQELNWDMRCSEDHWNKWISKPPGMMGLGASYTTGKLKFAVGDYSAMVKNPKMAKPFIKTFSIMGNV